MITSLLAALLVTATPVDAYFTIKVVDGQTGRAVPLIELRTVNAVKHYTDSNGLVAFREPGLMDQDVYFHVSGRGYVYPRDGFGNRGKSLHTTVGGSATLTVRRTNIAERLYRVTGAGIYRDSVLLGLPVPLKEPVLNSKVVGSDSVLTAVYRGKMYWFWGDTSRPSYPLGNFQVTGATSELPGHGGLDPDRGVDLTYFRDDKGFVKAMAPMPGEGPTWLVSVAVLPDAAGQERMYAGYVKVKPPLAIYRRGLAVFDDDKQQFAHVADVDLAVPAFPTGHTFRHTDDAVEYVYFANPFPVTRARARVADFARPADYENYTPILEGNRVERENGLLKFAWRKGVPLLGAAEETKLLAAGQVRTGEVRRGLRDRGSGKLVLPHAGSVAWNDYRRRWVMIFVESGGTSYLGEVWYTEADSPTGPWSDAVKIASHDRYSFYNPKQHSEFAKERGRVIYFEGTYSQTFTGNPTATPWYDYNQIMYKLDLTDPRLGLPAR
jgi:hypothetical protein